MSYSGPQGPLVREYVTFVTEGVVRRNKLNYPYCLRLPVFHKIKAWKSLVPVKEGMERMTLLLIHCKVGVLRVRS